MDKLYSASDDVEAFLKEGKIVEPEIQQELKQKIKNVEELIEANPDLTTLDDSGKDELFKNSNEIWNNYISYLKGIDYNVEIKGEEFHYIKDLVTKELHYNETDIFIAFKFKETFLDVVENLQKINRDNKSYSIKVKIHDIAMLHQLIKNESVKGLGKQAVYFKNTITMIGNIYKIFNVWNEESKAISDKIYNWTKGLLDEPKTEIVSNETAAPATV